jgi:hypothetical protein
LDNHSPIAHIANFTSDCIKNFKVAAPGSPR